MVGTELRAEPRLLAAAGEGGRVEEVEVALLTSTKPTTLSTELKPAPTAMFPVFFSSTATTRFRRFAMSVGSSLV